jgi:hypothetical protein
VSGPLSNYEVEKLLKKYVHGLKVYPTRARDEFKGKCPHGCGIVNLDSHLGEGTHFTLWMNIPNQKNVMYFDSFGVVPPENVARWLKTSGRHIAYSSSQVQPIESSLCGYFCVYVAAETLKHGFYDTLESFSTDPATNERMIIKYFS